MIDLENNYGNRKADCAPSSRKFGQKLMLFLIGGGIGATLALLFAPKSGSEFRSDIADIAGKRYDETLAAAHQLKRRSAELYEVAKETGNEVFDVVAAGISEVRAEVAGDVENIGAIVEDTAKQAVRSARHAGIF